ncbi:MAG: redoxin family protein [Gemmataceae bacterium]|nr:redoxin family protein [Gemmataceae bacterium]MCS7269854.1 redoxin family protein [Gemmataceae bacterium]MDW8241903.1 redoxin family protein [Thermogemmata sp.]
MFRLRSRVPAAIVLLGGIAGLTTSPHRLWAQDKDKQPPSKAPSDYKLKVGDPAPPLKADKWWNGDPVGTLEKGTVYVVEFWATWCGPCIVMMPHMSELQQQYKDKGVVFIGYTAQDPNNTEAKVTEFVKKRGSKLKYRFAYSDDRATYDAWMRAAGRTGIPCCFVVDRKGHIAYIGHPMYLDAVLPKVVADRWGPDDLATIEKIEQEVESVFAASRQPAEFLTKLEQFESKHPELAGIPYFNSPRILSALQAGKLDQAHKTATHILEKAIKYDDTSALQSLVSVLITPQASKHQEMTAIAIRAAEALVKINGEKDPMALYLLAEAHFAAGNKAKAKEIGAQALAAAADNPRLKQQLEQRIRRYED